MDTEMDFSDFDSELDLLFENGYKQEILSSLPIS